MGLPEPQVRYTRAVRKGGKQKRNGFVAPTETNAHADALLWSGQDTKSQKQYLNNGWRLAVGGWRLAVGGWRLAVGGWWSLGAVHKGCS